MVCTYENHTNEKVNSIWVYVNIVLILLNPNEFGMFSVEEISKNIRAFLSKKKKKETETSSNIIYFLFAVFISDCIF